MITKILLSLFVFGVFAWLVILAERFNRHIEAAKPVILKLLLDKSVNFSVKELCLALAPAVEEYVINSALDELERKCLVLTRQDEEDKEKRFVSITAEGRVFITAFLEKTARPVAL